MHNLSYLFPEQSRFVDSRTSTSESRWPFRHGMCECAVPHATSCQERQQRQGCAGLQRERSDEFKSRRICNTDKVNSRRGPRTECWVREMLVLLSVGISAVPQTFSRQKRDQRSGADTWHLVRQVNQRLCTSEQDCSDTKS